MENARFHPTVGVPVLSVFRIVAGLVFISAGTMKLFGYPANPMPDTLPVELMSQMGIGGLLEVVGGLLIVLGLFTRPERECVAGGLGQAAGCVRKVTCIYKHLCQTTETPRGRWRPTAFASASGAFPGR